MTSIRKRARDLWQAASGLLRTRRDTTPIDSVAKLREFVATRSAYIGQKTLYNYVRARMGIRYPQMFEDEQIIASLNIAKWHVLAGCLSDLTIFAVATAMHDQPIDNNSRHAMARQCYEAALCENMDEQPSERFSIQDSIDEFERRLEGMDWARGALLPENFTRSPQALYRWAPIADNLKKFDAEIVENSMKYAWRDIREQFHKRIDAASVYADWSRSTN